MVGKRGSSRTTVCPPDHKHAATGTCYNDHQCACDECLTRNTARVQQRRKLRAYGRAGAYRVEKKPAADRVRALRAEGWTVRGIAEAAGVPVTVVDSLLSKRYELTTNATSSAVLAVPVQPPARLKWKRVPSLGTIRRLEALAFMGWSLRSLERIGGFGDGYLSNTMRTGPLVHESTAKRVSQVYDRLWDKAPPTETNYIGAVTRTRLLARQRGWVGPLSWDDIDTDPEPTITGPDTDRSAWMVDELDNLREAGESPHTAARLLGRKRDSIYALATRHGRHDLAAWISPGSKAA